MIIIEGENESWSWHEKFESDFELGGGFRSTPVNSTSYNWLVTQLSRNMAKKATIIYLLPPPPAPIEDYDTWHKWEKKILHIRIPVSTNTNIKGLTRRHSQIHIHEEWEREYWPNVK